MPDRYRKFREFYPFYLTQHRHPICRLLHVLGVFASAGVLIVALESQAWSVVALSPLVGYACGWVGHFVFEGNRPASFRQPFFSFLGDLLMAWDVITGKLPVRSTEKP